MSFIRQFRQYFWTNQALGAVEVDGPTLNTGPTEFMSIQAGFTGATLTGNLQIQTSNDPINIGWTPFPGTVPVSGPSTAMWNIPKVGYAFVRLVYLPTSGTGTINAVAQFKNSL